MKPNFLSLIYLDTHSHAELFICEICGSKSAQNLNLNKWIWAYTGEEKNSGSEMCVSIFTRSTIEEAYVNVRIQRKTIFNLYSVNMQKLINSRSAGKYVDYNFSDLMKGKYTLV